MIGRLQRALASAFGRPQAAGELAPIPGRVRRTHGYTHGRGRTRDDAQRRIDDARQRLKATIPPPPED